MHTRVSSQSLIELVDNLIQEEYGDANFTGSWMLVGFWENVTDSDELIEVSYNYYTSIGLEALMNVFFPNRTLSKRF